MVASMPVAPAARHHLVNRIFYCVSRSSGSAAANTLPVSQAFIRATGAAGSHRAGRFRFAFGQIVTAITAAQAVRIHYGANGQSDRHINGSLN
jgi:hypothetical protein